MATTAGSLTEDLNGLEDWTQDAATTRCVRCSGLMVVEQSVDFPVRRCVQCGEVIDPVILRNRRHKRHDEPGSYPW